MPWALGAFSDCLGAGYDNWAIENAGQANAFLVMVVSAGEAHLLNFAVRPAHQRQGMGSWLLHQAQQYGAQRGADIIGGATEQQVGPRALHLRWL